MMDCFWCGDTTYTTQKIKDGVTVDVSVCSNCGAWTSNLIASTNAIQEESKSGK